jgi:hypothetical protein
MGIAFEESRWWLLRRRAPQVVPGRQAPSWVRPAARGRVAVAVCSGARRVGRVGSGLGGASGMGSLAGGASDALQGTRLLLGSQAAASSQSGAPRPSEAAKPDSKQPSGDRRYCAASVTSPQGVPDMEERTVARPRAPATDPCSRAAGLEAQALPAQTHDASNDSQMILSFTNTRSPSRAWVNWAQTKRPEGFPSLASCRPQRQEQHRGGASCPDA